MSCLPCAVDPVIGHHFAAGIYAKESKIPAGYVVSKHTHNYSHLSILASGKALLTIDGQIKEYTGPACIEIKANSSHKIDAITDVIWYCLHVTNETDLEKVDEILITKEK